LKFLTILIPPKFPLKYSSTYQLLAFANRSVLRYYWQGKLEYSFSFNGKEKIDEINGTGNEMDFSARIYDVRLGRWFAIDFCTSKHSDLTPFHFTANCPITYTDKDGFDIVKFDINGNEINRIVDDKIIKTLVQVPSQYISPSPFLPDPTPFPMRVAYDFIEAPMPGIIEGFSDLKFQKLDYQIAASTFIFNHNKNKGIVPNYTNGTNLENAQSKVPDLSPNVVKAVIMQETMMGTFDPNPMDKNDSKKDVMQANVQYSSTSTDWSESKIQFGLVQGGGVNNSAQSINAGIGILYQKGLKGGGGKTWTGGHDWMNAVLNYNGKAGHKEGYRDNVKKMSQSANTK
jgi:RHS repeat-associated protein